MKLSFALLVLAFHLQSNGVNAMDGLCRREANSEYLCGNARGSTLYWPVTTTCTRNQCCCHDQKGWEGGSVAYQRESCLDQVNSRIGCFACSGNKACNGLDNTDVGDSSCTGDYTCQSVGYGNEGRVRTIIGISSCNDSSACQNAEHNVTIGDGSCNANSVCHDCEAGSVVPDGTCNNKDNDDEVGTGTKFPIKDQKRCRACFVSTFHYIFIFIKHFFPCLVY